MEESKIIDELNCNKEMLNKAQQDLESKTIALEAESNANKNKIEVNEASTQTFKEDVLIIKKESSMDVERSTKADESKEQEKKVTTIEKETKADLKQINCKYFNKQNGCRRGKVCWFSHENKAVKHEMKLNHSQKKNVKIEPTQKPRADNHEERSNLEHILTELLKLCIAEKIKM